MKHCNIPIFIPHLGCPHQCVFCNQRSISGQCEFDESSVRETIERALETVDAQTEAEIAFFGGSFTGIDRALMKRLLAMAQEFVDAGRVTSIRLSTRPDMISPEILEILKDYSVKTVELGIQSTSDKVLSAARRGHTAEQAREACKAVKDAGFTLVGQMMIGLPASSEEDELQTAKDICDMGAAACRIYPTVVFKDTPLADMTEAGVYQPLSTDEAVRRSASALRVFLSRGVPCLRIGLCASDSLTSAETAIAGANHPAIGELVWNEIFYGRLYQSIRSANLIGGLVDMTVSESEISKLVGQRRCNVDRLKRETGTKIRSIKKTKEENVCRAERAAENDRRMKNEGEVKPCI